jgi:hypothetical protein
LAIAAGSTHSMVVGKTTTLNPQWFGKAWGDDSCGQLGDGGVGINPGSPTPVHIQFPADRGPRPLQSQQPERPFRARLGAEFLTAGAVLRLEPSAAEQRMAPGSASRLLDLWREISPGDSPLRCLPISR